MEQQAKGQTQSADKVLAFDTIFTNNHIKIMKILLSYLDSPMQKMLAVYIKFLELQYTLTYFEKHTCAYPDCHSASERKLDIGALCSEILPYCAPEERKIIEQIKQILDAVDMYRQFGQTFELMKEMFPDGFPSSEEENGANSPFGNMPFGTEMLSSLFGGENSQILDFFTAMMKN